MDEMPKPEAVLERLDELFRLIQGFDRSPWMTMKEAGRYLRCSKRKVEQLVAAGKLPYYRLDPSLEKSPRLLHRKHLAAFLLVGKNTMDQRLTSAERKMVDELF